MGLSRDLLLIEDLASSADVEIDRSLLRVAIREAEAEFPGETDEDAYRRLESAANSVGLRISCFETSLDDLWGVCASGTLVIARRGEGSEAPAGGDWLLLSSPRRRSVRTRIPGDRREELISRDRLSRDLGATPDDPFVRWATAVPYQSCGLIPTEAPEHEGFEEDAGEAGVPRHLPPTPLQRLFRLLRPEGQDLRAILAFGVGVGLLSLATPIAVESLVTTVAFGKLLQPVVVLALIVLTCLSLAAALRFLQVYTIEILQRRVFVRVVEELAHRLPRVEVGALDRQYGPELVNRFFDVLTVQKSLALLLTDGLALFLQTVIGLVVLAFYHPLLLGFDVVVVSAIVFAVFLLGRGAVATSIEESRAKYGVAGCLEEIARTPLAYRMGGAVEFALERSDSAARRYIAARTRHFRIIQRQTVFALAFQALASTALLGLGGWLVISGQLTLGQLVAAELIVATVASSFAKVGKHLESFYDLLSGVHKLGHLFDLPEERVPPASIAVSEVELSAQTRPASVRLHNLEYEAGERSILQGLDMEVTPGSRVVILGPSGSGKSTLGALLFGLREPTRGVVELDGIDLRDFRPEALRRHVALVHGVEVIDGSIADNVRMGRESVGPGDVRRALAIAGLLATVSELPEGIHTRLHPRGTPLSEGQVIQLMIARAVAGRPRLLVLDGTLDGLAPVPRRHLIDSLFDASAPWTLIVLTHNPEIARLGDRPVALPPPTEPGVPSGPMPLPAPKPPRLVG